MIKVVISERFGGFGLSPAAIHRIVELGTPMPDYAAESGIDRDNPHLVQAVGELGEAASCTYANLVVVEIPDDAKWYVHEYDGYETVYEHHRSWSSWGEE